MPETHGICSCDISNNHLKGCWDGRPCASLPYSNALFQDAFFMLFKVADLGYILNFFSS